MLVFFLSMIESPEDKAKFERIYLTYRKLMIKVAMDILHDNFIAEDATQQAFLQLIPNLGKIKDVGCHQTKNYLIIMVRRVCFAIYNEQKKILQIPYEDLSEEELESSEDDIFAELSYAELLEKIESLPVIYADALYLAYCEDYSMNEAATLLGISVSAVKKRLERARYQLRALLTEEEVMNA